MDDQLEFELKLADALRRYAADDQTNIDARALARSIAVEAPRRGRWWTDRTVRLPRLSLSPVGAVVLLVALLVAVGVAVGAYVLLETPRLPTPFERGVFQMTGPMAIGREQAAATSLADGRVLITGGFPPVRMAELFDPATGSFAPAGELATGRWGHTSTLLQDGRVLVAGGVGQNSASNASLLFSAEVWDPATMTFSAAGSSAGGHLHSVARLLPDGRVLITAGTLLTAGPSAAPEVWDPATATFSSGNTLAGADAPAGLLLEDGDVLWSDGTTVFMWHQATGDSQVVGALVEPLGSGYSATLLADGRVLIAGGSTPEGSEPVITAEIVDPIRATFQATGSLLHARAGQVAALLPDGRVLVAGGDATDGRSAELYEPP